MSSVLNGERPLFFCPGCSHDSVVRAVDQAAQLLGLKGEQLAIVSDIGCSGLFDTFFNSHAIHGLHGRALTYATGLKMARPDLTVIVIMGDGGLGIGGAHVLASCRRNLDITLLVLNNFNYGMTGGQSSSTTPSSAHSSSGFLNTLEVPLDICKVAEASGALFAKKALATADILPKTISQAVEYPGFALLDIWGLCPGRHLKKNPTTLSQLHEKMVGSDDSERSYHPTNNSENGSRQVREEYGSHYRSAAEKTTPVPALKAMKVVGKPLIQQRTEILVLGAAGQFINTVGEILCLAAMSSGLYVTQKNDYPITVLRGHSIAELVFDTKPVGYTGMVNPKVVICASQEGVNRRRSVFENLSNDTLVLQWPGIDIPQTKAGIVFCDLCGMKVKKTQVGLVLCIMLAQRKIIISPYMLVAAINTRYSGKLRDQALGLLYEIIPQMNSGVTA